MKREQHDRVVKENEQFARMAPQQLRPTRKNDRRTQSKRARDAANLVRLAAETREMMALWTYYRLACLEALETTHLGSA